MFVMDTRRDFVFVDDLVSVAMKAVDGGGESGVYHVSSGSDVSIKELFDATVKAMGIELEDEVEVRPRNPDDAPSILLDPSKTEARLRVGGANAARGRRREGGRVLPGARGRPRRSRTEARGRSRPGAR